MEQITLKQAGFKPLGYQWFTIKLLVLFLIIIISSNASLIAQSDSKNSFTHIPTIKQNEVDLSDEFKDHLRQSLKNVRILALGESTHQDGATFMHKIKLIKFLHEEMDFDVLAFEYSFYTNWLMDRELSDSSNVDWVHKYSGWNNRESFEIFDYMHQQKLEGDSLIFAGFDSEKVYFGVKHMRELIFELAELSETNYHSKDSLIIDSLIQAVSGRMNNDIEQSLSSQGRRRANELLISLSSNWRKQLNTDFSFEAKMKHYGLLSFLMEEKEQSAGNYRNIVRDKHMAERTKWLADSIYPDQKIILWGASGHFVHDMVSIERKVDSGAYGYYPYYQMGDWLDQWYAEKYYVIGFTAASGKRGSIFPKGHKYEQYSESFEIPKAEEGSYEAEILKGEKLALYIDLRNSENTKEKRLAFALGQNQDFSDWSSILDALYIIRRMEEEHY